MPILRPINRLRQWWHALQQPLRLPLTLCDQQLPAPVRRDAVAMRYHRLLHPINWAAFPERDLEADYPQAATPYAPFAAACLVKLEENKTYMSDLRKYLVEHPLLTWLLGFPLPKGHDSSGADVDTALPVARSFTRLLRKMPNTCLQFLLDETVHHLRSDLSAIVDDFGHAVSLDTKHIIAWVQQNNPKAYVENRYDPKKQPKGDKDCKLGCKRRHNQTVDADNAIDSIPTPTSNPLPARTVEVGEYYWGYASGVIATKVPEWGEFVLAEWTQTFERPDVSYFYPLLEQTEARLGFRPRFGAFDAAFDAYYVYEEFHRPDESWQSGFAAVPLTKRSKTPRTFDEQGIPLCDAGLSMICQYTFTCRTTLYEHERAHYVCPLKPACDTCPIQHKKASKGGCTLRLPTSPGARLRHQIDRESKLYKDIYKQRSATERINAQAVSLGIERPRLRNRAAITNQNSLIYVLINLRALQRIQPRLQQQAATVLTD